MIAFPRGDATEIFPFSMSDSSGPHQLIANLFTGINIFKNHPAPEDRTVPGEGFGVNDFGITQLESQLADSSFNKGLTVFCGIKLCILGKVAVGPGFLDGLDVLRPLNGLQYFKFSFKGFVSFSGNGYYVPN